MIWKKPTFVGLMLVWQQYGVAAQPTWPAPIDELEDIMLLNSGYRARGFATPVTPCSASPGPGRITASEWIRTAFHDLATGNTYTGLGGLDGSIAYETTSGENDGAGFVTSLTTFAPFVSSRVSLSDIISMAVYTATRSCGGPVIPVRGGHVDATSAGPLGVPLPQNAIGTFKNQFLRFGYNATEMISFVACGHSLGGVHAANFPDVLDPGTAPNDFAVFDTSPSIFDNKIATEYVSGTTKDPLTVGKSVSTKRNSDYVVFNSDKNVTITALQNAQTFASTCKTMFQRMIEVVPAGVTLTDTIKAYEIKPYDLQLTLLAGGSKIEFTGDIRVRTTQRSTSSIAKVQLVYQDRTGTGVATTIDTSVKGDASGFDDTFTFFGFSTELPADTSISSFNVVIAIAGGTTETWDNNGAGFKVNDTVMFQSPQSCLDASGKLTVVAAVRNSVSSPTLQVVVKNPQASPVVVPSLSTATAAMATQSAVGPYQLYSASYTFSGSQAQSAVFGVFASTASDNYKNASTLPTACTPLSLSTPTTTPSPSASAFQGCYTDNGSQRALATTGTADDDMSVEKCATFCSLYQYFGLEYGRECYCGNALDSQSVITGLSECNMPCSGNSEETCGAGSRLSLYENLQYTPPGNPQINGYNYSGCYSEGSAGRALSDSATSSDTMTVEACAAFCNGAKYFGVEYGRQCYCGSALNDGSVLQSASDCSMLCSGNSTEFCGAGNRLDLYQKLAASSSSTLTPTPTPSSSSVLATSSTVVSSNSSISVAPTIVVSSTSTPLLTSTITVQSSTNSISSAGASSSASITKSSVASSSSASSSPTASSPTTSSISSTRIISSSSSIFITSTTKSSSISSSTNSPSLSISQTPSTTVIVSVTPNPSPVSTTLSPSSTAITEPSFSGYTYSGCLTDSVENRTLAGKSLEADSNSYTSCASACSGYQYFGLEFSQECYCGNTLSASSSIAEKDEECNLSCSGNSTQICGAANRLTVFKSLIAYPPPANPAVTGYNYTGCHTDSVTSRVLQGSYLFDANMTIATCASFCNGAKYFGTQYGDECYCGEAFENPSDSVPEDECSYLCLGDRDEYCGAGLRLSLWTRVNSTMGR